MRVDRFPFNVGRECRSPLADERLSARVLEKRRGETPQLNDVYLLDHASKDLNISAVHFVIECIDGRFFLTDRCSACGTIVAGTRIGGDRNGGRVELRDGDEVVVGTSRSPYIFRFSVAPAWS